MNYNEAINGPDGVHWKTDIENENQQMLTNKVFEVVLHKDLAMGTKIIRAPHGAKSLSLNIE